MASAVLASCRGRHADRTADRREHLSNKAGFEFVVADRLLRPGVAGFEVELLASTLDAPRTGEEALQQRMDAHVPLTLDALRGLTDRPRDRSRRVYVVRGQRGILDVRSAMGNPVCAGAATDNASRLSLRSVVRTVHRK